MPDESMTAAQAHEAAVPSAEETMTNTLALAGETMAEANEAPLEHEEAAPPFEADAGLRDAILFGDAEEAEAAAAEAEERARERLLPHRISTAQFDHREQEAIALKHALGKQGEQISLGEACARVAAKYADGGSPAPSSFPSPARDEAEDDARDALTAMQREADALAARIDELDGEVVTPEYSRLTREHAERLADLKLARFEQRMKAEQVAERERAVRLSAREASKAETLQEYPTANDDASLLGGEISRIYGELMSDPGHPDRARFLENDGPRWLTERAVEAVTARLVRDLGYTPRQARAAVQGRVAAEAQGPTEATWSGVPRGLPVTARGQTAPRERADDLFHRCLLRSPARLRRAPEPDADRRAARIGGPPVAAGRCLGGKPPWAIGAGSCAPDVLHRRRSTDRASGESDGNSTPRNMKLHERISGLVVQALRHLGKEHVGPEQIATLCSRLSPEQRRQIAADAKWAPAWIAEVMRAIAPGN
jgi:hypothetical protein